MRQRPLSAGQVPHSIGKVGQKMLGGVGMGETIFLTNLALKTLMPIKSSCYDLQLPTPQSPIEQSPPKS